MLLSTYSPSAAESVEFVQVADLTALGVLLLTEHPGHSEHHTLLANGVSEPALVSRLQSIALAFKR